MELGRCPRCATPYSASEVVGFGVLRPRVARAGGPRMEYTCQACGRLIQLVPHGEGRYAPPGQPPPESVPPEARRPPWLDKAAAQPEAPPPPEEPPIAVEEPEPERSGPPGGAPMTAAEALELLGLSPAASAEEIEGAFRARSLTCHPDKVAHLDLEFQALAERKFKRLRRAYDLLLP